MSDGPLQQSLDWINAHYDAGAKELGVSCNPIKRQLFLHADKETLVINTGRSRNETRILKDIIHDHIGRLPRSITPDVSR